MGQKLSVRGESVTAGVTAAAAKRKNLELLLQLRGKMKGCGMDKKSLDGGEGGLALDARVARDTRQQNSQ
jgi:hypothetical protein